MSNFNLRRFTTVDVLKSIRIENLLAFLSPYREYFVSKGVLMPNGTASSFDYKGLIAVFMNPDEGMPKELIDALYFVDEMATTEGMDSILKEAEDSGTQLDLPAETTPADVAVDTWLKNRALLERKHAEQYLHKRRVFEYFQSDDQSNTLIHLPTEKRLKEMESELDDWFEKKKRGRDSRVFLFPKHDEIWFLVRHGEPYKREGSLSSGKSSSVFYRPEKHDIVVYDKVLKELRINAGSKGEKDLYRRKFGLYLFGDENHFPGIGKYTLSPLRADGDASVVCSDIEGMEWVKLKEIHYLWGGSEREVEIRKASDIFESLKKRGAKIPDSPRIIRAAFLIRFSDSKTPRTVTIRPSNIAEYTRDSDSEIVEAWLSARGFIIQKQENEDNEAAANVASA